MKKRMNLFGVSHGSPLFPINDAVDALDLIAAEVPRHEEVGKFLSYFGHTYTELETTWQGLWSPTFPIPDMESLRVTGDGIE